MLQKCIKTLFKQIDNITHDNLFNSEATRNSFMELDKIIKMRDRITDPLEKLVISLYTYIPFRSWLDFKLMYYTNKTLDQMKNANKHKKYITCDRKYIFNKYKTDSTYVQKIVDCPDEIY